MNEVWYSSPFYSHCYGYKLRLKCITTSPKWPKYKYDVLIQLQSVSGEYDDSLAWPIDIECKMEVVRQSEDGATLSVVMNLKNAGKPNGAGKNFESEKYLIKENIVSSRIGVTFFNAEIAVTSLVVKPIPFC